jgi:anti-sigma-K factor RskA
MGHEAWLAQADIYALGALDSDELTAFESHLAAGCPECERQIGTTREALTLLPHSVELVTPSPTVKARLLTQTAAETAKPQPVTRFPRRRWRAGVSALAVAGLLIVLGFKLYQTRQEVQHLRQQVEALQATIALECAGADGRAFNLRSASNPTRPGLRVMGHRRERARTGRDFWGGFGRPCLPPTAAPARVQAV